MKKKVWIFAIVLFVLVGGLLVVSFFVWGDGDLVLSSNKTVGVWWWKNEREDELLTFAKENDVDEIYYCDYNLNQNTYAFVKKAKEQGFQVYALWGECDWIFDMSEVDDLMEKYLAYQEMYPDAKLSGVHLDVEPHQLDEFNQDREFCMKKYVNFVYGVTLAYKDVTFDFDIPFWAHDMVTYDEQEKPVYAHVIDVARKAFVMSYRDDAESVVDVAKEELEYAERVGKPIVLSVETKSLEGDKVSFQEEGKKTMYDEISNISKLVKQDYAISIHNIETWKDLKDE